MTKEEIKSLLKSNSNLMDEEEDMSEYIDSLDWSVGQRKRSFEKVTETFKDNKYNRELATIAHNYGLQNQKLKRFC